MCQQQWNDANAEPEQRICGAGPELYRRSVELNPWWLDSSELDHFFIE